MVHTTSSEIEQLEYIGSGLFGKVLKKDRDTAYKVYFSTVKDEFGQYCDNPTLKLSKRRFNRLVQRSKELKYTSGILDTLSVDGEFSGVVMPYHYGTNLIHVLEAPLSVKIDLSKQLVRNAKELTHHHIYPCDYKLNNILLEDGNIQIIDLDDIHTHVCCGPNPFYKAYSLQSLNETIQTLLFEFGRIHVPKSVSKELEREGREMRFSYNSLEAYIQGKEEKKDVLYIDSHTDIDALKELLKKHPYKLVYVIPEDLEENQYMNIILELKKHHISLYDITYDKRVKDYPTIDSVRDSHYLKGKELVKEFVKQ